MGLTTLTAVVTDVVRPLPHAELAAEPAATTPAAAVAELEGWVTVVDADAAAVVVVGLTVGTVFITELTLPDWLDITILD